MSDADWRDRPSSYAESAVKGLSALLVAGLAFYLITNKGSDEGSNAGRKSRLSSARGASARSDLHKDTTVDGEVLYGEVLDPAEVQQTKLAASSNYSSQNSRNVHFEDPSTGSLQMENLALPQSPLLEHSHLTQDASTTICSDQSTRATASNPYSAGYERYTPG